MLNFFFCCLLCFPYLAYFERSTPRWVGVSLAKSTLTNFKLLRSCIFSTLSRLCYSQYLSLLICILNSPNESLLLFLASSSNSRTNTQNFIYIFTLSSSVLKFHVLRFFLPRIRMTWRLLEWLRSTNLHTVKTERLSLWLASWLRLAVFFFLRLKLTQVGFVMIKVYTRTYRTTFTMYDKIPPTCETLDDFRSSYDRV